jgi:hypothetical protein
MIIELFNSLDAATTSHTLSSINCHANVIFETATFRAALSLTRQRTDKLERECVGSRVSNNREESDESFFEEYIHGTDDLRARVDRRFCRG